MLQPGSEKLFVEFGDGGVDVPELKLESKVSFPRRRLLRRRKWDVKCFQCTGSGSCRRRRVLRRRA